MMVLKRSWRAPVHTAQADIKCGDGFEITGFVFVECANQSAADEAKWVLDMVT